MQHVDFRYRDNKCRERATHFFSTKRATALRRWPEARGISAHGHVIRRHSHPEDQLLFASEGVMTVETIEGVWVVPPLRAVWIPAETAHAVTMSGRVSMRTLYILPRLCRTVPRRCLVINISSLLRELILHACEFSRLRKRVAAERHVIELILDQLKLVESIPVQLPHPTILARKEARRSTARKSARTTAIADAVDGMRREQEDDATALCGRERNVVQSMAPAGPTDLRDAELGSRRIGHKCCTRSRL